MRIDQVDELTFVVSLATPSAGDDGRSSGPATRVTVTGTKVTHLQQYPSRTAALKGNDPLEDAAIEAVRTGDTTTLTRILRQRPDLATARLLGHGDRTLLHVATDWPGHFPHVKDTIAVLIAAGADVNAPSIGDHTETPLHWAASSDDIDALDALLDAGADIEASGAVIGGGTPLSDATAFGCWAAAHRLIERGAHPQFWEAAALGLKPHLRRYLDTTDPTPQDITHAFWSACHGNQPEAAALLLEHGADINWVGYDDLTPLGAAERSGATTLLDWLRAHGAMTTSELTQPPPSSTNS
ncbi:ankyrin repeat domain-containing protein (plasmid) [Streptomyces mirabilis]|nr:ankyrin repeat domain-containing protein [Streptomyces mirabilis]